MLLFSGPTSSRKVYVVNLPAETKWQELKDIFRKEVGEVTHANVYPKRNAGIVEFLTAELTTKALNMKTLMVNDKKVNILECVEGERDKFGNLIRKVEGKKITLVSNLDNHFFYIVGF